MSSLPTPQEILSGTVSLKPLHYDAESLRQILAGFEEVPISEASAKTIIELSHYLADAEWAATHNAAQRTLHEALDWAKQAGPELRTDAQCLETFFQAQLPNATSLKAICNPELAARIAPVSDYLQHGQSKLLPWMELTPRQLSAEPKLTVAAYKLANPLHATHLPHEPHVHSPACGHSHHEHDHHHTHEEAHLHGSGCGHDHGHTHVHGEACGHVHGPKGFKAALPKGRALRNTLIGGAIAAAGAIVLNFLGSKQGEQQKEAEKSKTEKDRATDIAYTINHAISCGTTDVVLQPVIAATFGINVGCNDPSHRLPGQKFSLRSFLHEAGHYLKGEIIGDLVAVPLTIGVQRLFPNFMHGVRKVVEPLTGWAFRLGTNHAAQRWGKQQGLAADAPEVKAHADAMYEHEVRHLPQAVVWNMFAYPIGAFGQKAMGHGSGYAQIFKSKLVGAAVSNGILIGGRMLTPGAAQTWDRFAGDNFIAPMSKTVGKIFGVDEKTMERTRVQTNWKERVSEDKTPEKAMQKTL